MAEDALRVDLGEGRPTKRFRDVAALRSFMEEEVAFLQSLGVNIDSDEARADVRQTGKALLAAYQYVGQLEALEGLEATRGELTTFLRGSWPHVGSPERLLLERLVQQKPEGTVPRRAGARYAFTLLYPGSAPAQGTNPREAALASFAVAALEFGAELSAKPTFRDLAKSQKAANDRVLADLEGQVSQLEAEIRSTRASVVGRMQQLNTRVIKNLRNFRRVRTKHWSDTQTSIAATQQAYREQMRLHESVRYWEDKEEKHNDIARSWFWATVIGAVAVLVVPILAWWVFSGPDQSGTSTIVSRALRIDTTSWRDIIGEVKRLSLVLLASGITVWALRFAARVYLSERHLATDARERQTIVMTYLALLKESAATDAERAIVLQTLFRSSSDGIVKDDAGMDPSLAGLLGKVIEKIK